MTADLFEIFSCRAILVQLGFYMHMQHVMRTTHYTVSRPVVFAMSFMLVVAIVIALFKDIPDIKGDSLVRHSCHRAARRPWLHVMKTRL